MSLLEVAQRRVVVVTGKGGVGKTTVSAALGRAWARRGKRVLIAEIVPHADTPSQLAAALNVGPPTETPEQIAPNLSLTLVTPPIGHLRFLQDALPLKVLADAAMKSAGLRRFLSAAPGFSDMGVLYRLLDLLKHKRGDGSLEYELLVVDSPATGHALALAQIPEFLARVIPAGPIARAAKEGIAVLTDPKVTGCVIVTLPETLPATEALELKKGLAGHGLDVSAIVVNRVPEDPFSAEEWRQLSTLPAEVLGVREARRVHRAKEALNLLPSALRLPELDAAPVSALEAYL